MCFELDSLPPIPQISGGGPVRSEDVVLEAADGTRLAAFAAQPDDGARVGIAEERHWGGTCVNIGCVPKKLLV